MTRKITRNQAIWELVFAGSLWGFGFVANKWGLLAFQPMEILFYRFAIGFLAGEAIHLSMFRTPRNFELGDMKRALPAGALLSLFLIPQTVGMQYTTATNSGFLTTLYVVFVPIINHFVFRVKVSRKVYGAVALALLGAFLLMGGHFDQFNRGDMVTLICAVMGAFHIIYLGRISRFVKNAVRFNNWQTLFCLISVLPFLILQDKISYKTDISLAWIGIIFLGIGSSAIAFIFQVRAQSILSDTTASMLFLLESPFAFLFGFLFLSERLSPLQLSGALVIMISSALTILWDSPVRSKSMN